ncbi:MAG: transglutaminase-like domain-containing protein [Ruminococcus sp.]|nr:transglutaminase-like domain-containing protein [Ruminococcus sp.]MCM1381266.1 transglutaminase-like domain-containing protein [Muribaculaceae bacterium]MCM1478617.1 transglutaminase-like domain-containing protein [Muribaculaceae bacterium]
MRQGKKAEIYTVLLLCTAFLSSCGHGGSGEAQTTFEQSSSVSVSETEIPEISREISETTEISIEKTETDTVSGTISETVTSPEEQNPETLTETENSKTEISRDVSEIPESSTEISETKTEISEKITEITTTAKPKAEVVIPKINMPKTGNSLISGDNSEVDYSYAAEGYISALYSGTAAAAKLRIICGEVRYDHDLTPGKREFFPLMGSGNYEVQLYEQFSGNQFAKLAEGSFQANIASSVSTYLYPNKYVDFDSNSQCVKKAAEVCAGITDSVEKIAEIFTYVTENISYDKTLAANVRGGSVTSYVPYPDTTLSKGTGICFDYTSLFAAMCRSQGIPARLVIGYAEPEIYHAWNEVYTEETGWITPELFLKNKGYNIADATFYSSNSDKEKIAAYISDEGNYSAVYRY